MTRVPRLSRRAALAHLGAGGVAATLSGRGYAAAAQEATPRPDETGTIADRLPGALARLDEIARDTLERTGIPGLAIAVVAGDAAVFLEGYGVREAGTDAAVDADTVFTTRFLSKPIASTVVANVVGDSIVTWDTPVSAIDPGFALHDPWVTRHVTPRDLFAHRSGLPEHAGDLLEDLGFDRETVLHRLRYQPLVNDFRATYAYTNFGLTAAAVAAATAAGTTWEALSADRLYQPLGMDRTSSRYVDFLNAENRARGHAPVGDGWALAEARDPDPQSPAGGVSSTVRDLAQWLRLQLNGGMIDGEPIVAADALAETHRPQIVSNPPADPATDRASFYGLGWNVAYDGAGRVRLSHSGAFNLGAATSVFLVPAEQLGIVILTNAQPIGAPEAIALSFLDLALTGEVTIDYLTALQPVFAEVIAPAYGTTVDYAAPLASPAPALSPDTYMGRYANDYFGPIAVVAEGDRLDLHIGPNDERYPLRHYDRDVFLYQPPGENAFGPSAATFTVDADGTASRVVIENLDIHGQGSFVRAPDQA